MNKIVKDVQTFTNINFGKIRCIEDNGVVMFAGIDVARALGYKNPAATLNNKIPEKEKRRYMLDISAQDPNKRGASRTVFIKEAAVYRLVFSSTLPDAEKFQDWVFEDVLPSMRTIGPRTRNLQYYKDDPAYKNATPRVREIIDEFAGPATLGQLILSSDGEKYTVPELANIMYNKGYEDAGGNKMYQLLRRMGLIKSQKAERNRPTKFGVENGFVFELVEIEDEETNKTVKTTKKTCITPAGVMYIKDAIDYLGGNEVFNAKLKDINSDKRNADGFIVLDFVDEEATKKAMKNRKD